MNAPTPIPLRADPSATQRAAMQSLTRACLGVGLRALNRVERSCREVIAGPGGCSGFTRSPHRRGRPFPDGAVER